MKKKASMSVLFITVFMDLIGFGIVLPLLPFFATFFDVSGFWVAALSSVFSLMQFMFAPLWGRLSDRIGRRPVMLISLAGSTISYVALGFCTSFWQIFATRIFAGIFGGNIAVANAYIADITPPEGRSRGMGLIGAAFGLGFVLGPALGGSIAYLGEDPSSPQHVYHLIGWIAGGICAVNWLSAFFVLPESLVRDHAQESIESGQSGILGSWKSAFSRGSVGYLILLYFILSFAFANFEALFALLIKQKFDYDVKQGNLFFLFLGLVLASVQGGMIGRLVKMFGERKLIVMGALLLAGSLILMPFAQGSGSLLAVLTGLGIGQGLNRSSIMGLISQSIQPSEQGAILGVAQSSSSLARILGPMVGGMMFDYGGRSIPFVVAGGLVLLILLFGTKFLLKSAASS